MIQARILNSKRQRDPAIFATFPAWVGRNPAADLVLEEAGIFDQHLELNFKRHEGFFVRVIPPAIASLNGRPLEETRLKNGDVVQAGAVSIQFWLLPPEQRSLQLRETSTWIGLVIPAVVQVYLVYWLLHLTAW